MKTLHFAIIITGITAGIILITNSSFAYGDTNQTSIPMSTPPFWITVNPNTNIAYVERSDTTGANGIISMIHGSIHNIVIDIQTYMPQTKIVVNPVTNMLYFGYTYGKNYIAVMDGSTNEIVNTIQISTQAPQLAINPSTNKLYVTDNGPDTGIDVIDVLTNKVTKIKFPTYVYPIEVNPSTNKLYLGSHTENQTVIEEVDGSTYKILDKIPVPYGIHGLMVNPKTNFLYVADGGGDSLGCDVCHSLCQNGFVYIIDLTTKKFVANSTVIAPDSFSINPNTHKVYVSSSQFCRTVTVIDEDSGKVLYSISNSTWAVVNPKTNKVYLSHYFDSSISVISDSGTRLIPPLQQFKSGIATTDIQCGQGLQLIIQKANDHPACVTQKTMFKLVHRGWIVVPLIGLHIPH